MVLVWKYKKVDKNRDLWTKGKDKDWIMVDKTPDAINKYTNDKYSVGAKRRINPETYNGHYRFYKNKASAIKYARAYMRKY